jgi:hypothetical protein
MGDCRIKPTNKRKAEHHNKMIEAGFKKRSFYVSEADLIKLGKIKIQNGYSNLSEVLSSLIKNSGDEK